MAASMPSEQKRDEKKSLDQIMRWLMVESGCPVPLDRGWGCAKEEREEREMRTKGRKGMEDDEKEKRWEK